MRPPRLTLLLALTAPLLAAACDHAPAARDDAPAPAPKEEEVATTHDDGALAPAAVIRVEKGEDGQDKPETAVLRETPAVGELSAAAIEAAFAAGQNARIAGRDELDADTSSASWTEPGTSQSFASYRPQATNGQNTYTYTATSSHDSGVYRYFYYARPRCTMHCSPAPTPPMPGYDLDAELLAALAKFGVKPAKNEDYFPAKAEVVELGKKLFHDKNLSGPRNTACVTCHVPALGTSNRVSLGPTLKARGGAYGDGVTMDKLQFFRTTDLLPRNSPSLYNRGHKSYTALFWDSRVNVLKGPFETPAGDQLPPGLDTILAAQALFPLANRDEMLGCLGSNDLSRETTLDGIWAAVTARVAQQPEYAGLFAKAYPNERPGIRHIANALAAYQIVAFRSDDAPFDRYVRGDMKALKDQEKLGASYFYGKAKCAGCHSGIFQTDGRHHAIAIPQWGPGTGDGPLKNLDFGFERVSKNPADRYKFRTPSLRNVALSGPWGHNGSYSTLKGFVTHYTGPAERLRRWDRNQVYLPFAITGDKELFRAHDDGQAQASLAAASGFPGVKLTSAEIDAIVAFLHSLTEEKYVPAGGHLYRR